MEIRGRAAEKRSAAAARIRRGLSWKAWAADLDEHLDRIDQLMWPNLMILGGGVSKSADKFVPRLTVRTAVVPALLRNDAGIIGAAIVAAEAPIGDRRTRSTRSRAGRRPPRPMTSLAASRRGVRAERGRDRRRGAAADRARPARGLGRIDRAGVSRADSDHPRGHP